MQMREADEVSVCHRCRRAAEELGSRAKREWGTILDARTTLERQDVVWRHGRVVGGMPAAIVL